MESMMSHHLHKKSDVIPDALTQCKNCTATPRKIRYSKKKKKNGLIFLKNARTEYSSFNPSFTRVALVHIITAPD